MIIDFNFNLLAVMLLLRLAVYSDRLSKPDRRDSCAVYSEDQACRVRGPYCSCPIWLI
jgi:hypothetical protein